MMIPETNRGVAFWNIYACCCIFLVIYFSVDTEKQKTENVKRKYSIQTQLLLIANTAKQVK